MRISRPIEAAPQVLSQYQGRNSSSGGGSGGNIIKNRKSRDQVLALTSAICHLHLTRCEADLFSNKTNDVISTSRQVRYNKNDDDEHGDEDDDDEDSHGNE